MIRYPGTQILSNFLGGFPTVMESLCGFDLRRRCKWKVRKSAADSASDQARIRETIPPIYVYILYQLMCVLYIFTLYAHAYNMYIYIYIHLHICICVCVFIYMLLMFFIATAAAVTDQVNEPSDLFVHYWHLACASVEDPGTC